MIKSLIAGILITLFLLTSCTQPPVEPPSVTETLSATLIVNTTDDTDDGVRNATHCSLKEAINAPNDRPGPDTITFDPLMFSLSEIVVIELTSKLPTILDGNTTIDASGAHVTVNGSKLDGMTDGFGIQSSNYTLDNITIINSGHGGPPSFTGRHDTIEIRAHDMGSRTCFNRVVNCTVENNIDNGIEIVSDEGGVAGNNFIVDNISRGNAEVGIEIDAKSAGCTASRNTVANNIVEGHDTKDGGGIVINSHGEGGRGR